jgi:ATP-dependent protease HslVU (ClpYQ) peptidase subunit
MTCIVGVVDKGKVYIGGDSAGVAGSFLVVRSDAKVFESHGFLYGFTSSFRMGQLIRYRFRPPKRHSDDDMMKYMVTDFVDALRGTLKSGGFAETKDGAEFGGTFLVGHCGRLFVVDSDYQVAEWGCGYGACGSGMELAVGALHATKGQRPEGRIKAALEAAEAHCTGACGPFTILSVGDGA